MQIPHIKKAALHSFSQNQLISSLKAPVKTDCCADTFPFLIFRKK